ncbi:monovalent cation/H+ antiporter subunit F [Sphingomonas sp. SRS2]|nr:monovalent cation/H+ antiporter subunit F [Sphingomonas sp. SRS2]
MDRAHQEPLRDASDGDIRLNTLILALAITAAQIILGLAMGCAAFRVMRGPRAQDRVLGLDALYLAGMLLLLTYGIQTGRTLFFEGALVIALLGFAGTVAFAKFLMRGEVIE